MNQDQCHEILWNHFDYEFEAQYETEVGLDEFVEDANSTKRDYIIDAFGWMAEDLADADAPGNSVEYACHIWVNDLFDCAT